MGTDYLVKRVAERTDSSPEQVEKMMSALFDTIAEATQTERFIPLDSCLGSLVVKEKQDRRKEITFRPSGTLRKRLKNVAGRRSQGKRRGDGDQSPSPLLCFGIRKPYFIKLTEKSCDYFQKAGIYA